MITLPVRVGYTSVRVEAISPAQAQGNALFGVYYPLEQLIRIRSDLTPAEQARVLVHELIHAAFDAFDIEDRKRDEETTCEALDGPLTMLLTDNPWLAGVLHQAVSLGVPVVERT